MDDVQPNDHVTLVQLPAQPGVSIRETIPVAELGQHYDERIRTLVAYLAQHGTRAAGPPWVRYHTFEEAEADVELGLPVPAPVAGYGRIASVELPAGPAIVTWHAGPHPQLGEAYARIFAWLQETGRTPGGLIREVYWWLEPGAGAASSAEQPTGWHTQLVQPLASDTQQGA